jgi:hypothetical protein
VIITAAPPSDSSAGWKDEVNAAVNVEFIAMFGHVARRTEQHRRVPIVTAGMHSPLASRTMGKVVLFLQGKGIHVGPKANGTAAVTFAQDADNAGCRETAIHFQPAFDQFARHHFGSSELVESKFGMRVKVVPNGREISQKGNFQSFHGPGLSS